MYLVIGNSGLVGQQLVRQLQSDSVDFLATTRNPQLAHENIFFDLADPNVSAFDNYKVDTAIITAAMSRMPDCEAHPKLAMKINFETVVELFEYFKSRRIYSIFISSTQVFDGQTAFPDENSILCPKNVYGTSKSKVEAYLRENQCQVAVIRPGKILGSDLPGVPDTLGMFGQWKGDLVQGKQIKAAVNIPISPLSIHKLISFIRLLAASKKVGLWNYTAADSISYYDAAVILAEELEVSTDLVVPDEVDGARVNPDFVQKNVALNSTRIGRDFDIFPEKAEAVLRDAFRSLWVRD